jgi:beta-N-acetylhexosaminidase
MSLSLAQAVGQKQMLSFQGRAPSAEILATLERQHIGGVTLFRAHNVDAPAQVRELTAALQRAAQASGQPPILIGVDQEGGTLMALAGTTPFPGNLALGAAGSADLARRAGVALGRELAAMGLNVNYAPVCDVNVNPENPVVGTRSFGGDPAKVAELSSALVAGLQAAGVAATAKHFPGHGDTAADSHHGVPVLPHDEARLRSVELLPFGAAVRAGVKLVMTAHVALPALTGSADLPATLSPAILRRLLRGELGFDGVIISDALDMMAIRQGAGFAIDAITAVAAGADLLTLNADLPDHRDVYEPLLQAAQRGLLDAAEVRASAERVLGLKAWCAQVEPPALEVVGCGEHRALAFEIAARAVTLVRDEAHRLPLRLRPEARLAVVVPQPADLTPADTSSYVKPALAEALRAHHGRVDEYVIPINPIEAEATALGDTLRGAGYDLVVVGTINANDHPGQAALVNALVCHAVPTVAAALRMPYDLRVYPSAPTYVCAYSIQPPAMEALAQALMGKIEFAGRLPVEMALPEIQSQA